MYGTYTGTEKKVILLYNKQGNFILLIATPEI